MRVSEVSSRNSGENLKLDVGGKGNVAGIYL
jgi:uncharacterized protein YuzE